MVGLLLLWLFGAWGPSPAAAPVERIVVIAHRGEHRQHPENTIPAFQAAIEMGADFIEVDVRTTSDGRLVLMHDRTVDGRTNGSGEVEKMTLAQIRALDAGIKSGPQFAGTRVPTFEEVLELARGKIGIYIDCKDVSAPDLVAAVEKSHMEDNVVVYGGPSLLRDVLKLNPRIKAMPESFSAPAVRAVIETLHPPVIAFNANDFTDEIIAIARQAGADIYVDRLGPADNPAAWQNAIDRGATGIQTDRPGELIEYLRSKGLRK